MATSSSLLGPEPALRWRLFTDQLIGIARRFDVSMVLTLGALLADVPHIAPVQLIGTATEQDVIDRFDLQRSRYEGPTGIVGVAARRVHPRRPRLGIAVGGSPRLRLAGPVAEGLARARRACLRDHRHARARSAASAGRGRTTTTRASPPSSATTPTSSATSSRLESLADSGELDDDFDDDELDDDDDDDDSVGGELGPEHEVNSDDLMAEVERFLRDQEGGK